jgi:glycosyltransferase involved in cell wall biosynthesis
LSYVHDPSNSGLCTAFNYALGNASADGSEWLLLLDHDTTLTRDYIVALVDAVDLSQGWPQDKSHALQHDPIETSSTRGNAIGAFVPLLEFEGRIYSPEETFFYHMRHQFRHIRYYRCSPDTAGLQTRPLNAYNSGAALRVSALLEIGGFPKEFPLDYLDFAVFHLLHARGYKLYVIGEQLHQELSHGDLNDVSFDRHTSVMLAQTRFVARYGTMLDRLLFRLWLARMSRRYKESCRDPRVWKNMLRQSIGLPLLP